LPISDFHTASEGPQKDNFDLRRQPGMLRCWHRGTQESDLILARFAETSLTGFDSGHLDRLEALFDHTDPDLFDQILDGFTPPPDQKRGRSIPRVPAIMPRGVCGSRAMNIDGRSELTCPAPNQAEQQR